MSHERAVRRTLTGRVRQAADEEIEVTSVFSYLAEDPFAVSISFSCEGEAVEWWVGREILFEGLMGPSGVPGADFRVVPLRRHDRYPAVVLALASPFGRAAVEFPSEQVSAFLSAAHELVPRGAESAELDMDAGITAVLDSA